MQLHKTTDIQPLVSAHEITVTYPNGFKALRKVSFEVFEGQRIGIVGMSGSGKSTLIKTLLGVLPINSQITGNIKFQNLSLLSASAKELRQLRGLKIGYIAQDPYASCDPLHTVGHHVASAATMHGVKFSKDQVIAKFTEIAIPQAEKRVTNYPWQFSGGMLQRASIVAGTLHQPPLVLADEPTSALDAELANSVLQLIAKRSQALLLVTHDLSLAKQVCNSLIVMEDGEIVLHDATNNVLNSRHPAIQKLKRSLPENQKTLVPKSKAPATDLITLDKISHGYEKLTLFKDLSFKVKAGEILGIQGASGCGKTTLLRIISGIESPQSGRVLFHPKPKVTVTKRPASFIMPIFQNPVDSLSPRWKIWKCLAEPLIAKGIKHSKKQWQEWAEELVAKVGLANLDVTKLPRQLSVGQAQRIAIARALAAKPAVIVADEPSASLDVVNAEKIYNLLSEIASTGTGVVIVSHDIERLVRVSHNLLIYNNQEFQKDGSYV